MATLAQNVAAYTAAKKASGTYGTPTVKTAPTVVASANINEKIAPALNNKANVINQGYTANPANPANAPKSDGTVDMDKYISGQYDQMTKKATLDPFQEEQMNMLKSLQSRSDAQTAQSLATLQQQYEQQRADTVESQKSTTAGIENALILGGGARYAPISSSGIVSAKQKFDLQTLNELATNVDARRNSILEAQASRDYQNLSKQLELYQTAKQAQQKKIDEMITNAREANKVAAAAKLKQQEEINKIAVDAKKGGMADVTPIMQATTLGEAVNAAGDYLQGGTGIVGEYQFYKRDALTRGLVPVDFDTYQTQDANRKVSIAKAGVGATGLPASTLTKVESLASKFGSEQSVKNYQVVAEGKSFLDSIPNNTKNPADQQGVIYAFAKIMDPNSVVREGEYNTVQKYAQSWANTFGFNAKRIFSNSPFLSESAIKNMKATIKSKVNASESNYKNIYNEYGRKIDLITGSGDGKDYLVDYTQGFNNVKDDIIQTQEANKTKVIDTVKTKPDLAPKVRGWIAKGMSYDDILQAFPEYFK